MLTNWGKIFGVPMNKIICQAFDDLSWCGFCRASQSADELSLDMLLTVGAVYLFNENIQVDAFLSHAFKNTPSMFAAGIGVSMVDRYNDNGIP